METSVGRHSRLRALSRKAQTVHSGILDKQTLRSHIDRHSRHCRHKNQAKSIVVIELLNQADMTRAYPFHSGVIGRLVRCCASLTEFPSRWRPQVDGPRTPPAVRNHWSPAMDGVGHRVAPTWWLFLNATTTLSCQREAWHSTTRHHGASLRP